MLTEKLTLCLCVFFMLSCESTEPDESLEQCEATFKLFDKHLPVNSGFISATINEKNYVQVIDTVEFPIFKGTYVASYQPCPSFTFLLRTDSLAFEATNVKGIGEYELSTISTDYSRKYKGHYGAIGGSGGVWGFYGRSIKGNYSTSSFHKGKLIITRLDSDSMLASGTFEFEAFDSILMQSIEVRNGKFEDFRIIPRFF